MGFFKATPFVNPGVIPVAGLCPGGGCCAAPSGPSAGIRAGSSSLLGRRPLGARTPTMGSVRDDEADEREYIPLSLKRSTEKNEKGCEERGRREEKGPEEAVSRVLSAARITAGLPFLYDARRRAPEATLTRGPRGGPPLTREFPRGIALLFGLAPGGVCRAGPVARPAVSSYLAVSPLPPARTREAVCFLWRCPRGRPHRGLPGTLPCGARTFLPPR